jgi:hypothetical protein
MVPWNVNQLPDSASGQTMNPRPPDAQRFASVPRNSSIIAVPTAIKTAVP